MGFFEEKRGIENRFFFRWVNCYKKLKRIFKFSIIFNNVLRANGGSRFRRNFLNVAKANIFANSILLAFTPLLTRLYTPNDFGTLAIFSSSLGLLAAFATWRFDWSIPNASSTTQATALLLLGFMFLIISNIIVFFPIFCFNKILAFWSGFPILRPFLPFLIVALLGTGLHQLMQAWFIRKNDLTAVSKTKLSQSIFGIGVSISGGMANMGALGLIISSVVSAWVGIGILLRHASDLRISIKEVSSDTLKRTFFAFVWESTLSTAVSAVNTLGLAATPLLLAQYYSAEQVGWYALMYRLAIAPASLFTGAIAQSFWSEASVLVHTDLKTLRMLFVKSSLMLGLFSIPVLLLCVCGPFFVGLLFGKQWNHAGYILLALSPHLMSQIIVSPLSHLVVHRKQHWQFAWEISRFTLLVTILYCCSMLQLSIASSVFVISLLMFIMYAILFKLNLVCLELHK